MKRIRDKNGNSIITTPIIIGIGLIIVTTLIVTAINIITPYLWYEKLSSTCIKYIYVMEEYGYLTGKEAKELKNELLMQGFDNEKIRLKYTNYKVDYGEPISLLISYDYELKLPFREAVIVPMIIERSSVSKR